MVLVCPMIPLFHHASTYLREGQPIEQMAEDGTVTIAREFKLMTFV